MALFTIHLNAIDHPERTYFLKHIDSKRGLPSNRVPSIYYDSHGYLWAATYNGVARYNGNSAEVFSRVPGEGNTLKTNQVNAVLVENSDTWIINKNPTYKAWLGLNNSRGIQILENGIFTESILEGESININGIIDTPFQEILALSGSRVYLLSKYDDKKKKYDYDGFVTSATHFIDTYVVGTTSGIRFTDIEIHDLKDLSDKKIRSLDSFESTLLIGTEEGLFIFSKENNSLKQFFKNQKVRALNITKNSILIGTYDGVFECDKIGLIESNCRHMLPGKITTKIITDIKSGLSWVATANDGVFQLNHLRNSYLSFAGKSGVQYHSHTISDSGVEWIASDGDGVWRKNGTIWKRFSTEEIGNHRALAMMQDSQGKVWVGHYNGVSIINESDDVVKNLLEGKIVLSISEKDGQIYIGTDKNGVFIFTSNGTLIDTINGKNGLTNQTITALHPSSTNGLWIGTSQGLFYKANSGPLQSVLSNKVVWSLYEKDETLLVGTEGDGLLLLNGSNILENFTTKNSNLSSNTISDIGHYKNDRGNDIFIFTTLNGVSISQGHISGKFRNLSERDGLTASEYLRNSLSIFGDNKFSVAGARGWSTIKDFTNNSPVSISTYPIYLESNIAEEIPFGKPIYVSFKGVNHLSSHPLSYKYKLSGKDTVDLNGQTSTVIDELSPGQYTLRISTSSKLISGNREISFRVLDKPGISGINILHIFLYIAISILFITSYLLQNRKNKSLSNQRNALQKRLDNLLMRSRKNEELFSSIRVNSVLPPDLPGASEQIGLIETIKTQLKLSNYSNKFHFECNDHAEDDNLPTEYDSYTWWILALAVNHAFNQKESPEEVSIRITSTIRKFEMMLSFVEIQKATRDNLESTLLNSSFPNVDLDFKQTINGAYFKLIIDKRKI